MSGEPELRLYMNMMALDSLPSWTSGPRGTFDQRMASLKAAGFRGVQFAENGTPAELHCCRALDMGMAASGRVNNPAEAERLAERIAGDDYECATVHAGWGLEDDDAACRLIEGILNASERWRVPLYIETHRATICQDMWRTVQFISRFPEMRFNGDFSHWYTGQEMVYGNFEEKFAFIRPVLERVRFLHGRIASPGCIQVAIDAGADEAPVYVGHFRKLWTAAFRGFLAEERARSANSELKFICFAPELLGPDIFYARTFNGMEESDRWQQSMVLAEIAQQCFACAQSS